MAYFLLAGNELNTVSEFFLFISLFCLFVCLFVFFFAFSTIINHPGNRILYFSNDSFFFQDRSEIP